jgi:hypothetical protein
VIKRHKQEDEGPVEGIPEWMWTSLLLWLGPIFTATKSKVGITSMLSREPSSEFLLLVERQARIKINFARGPSDAIESLVNKMYKDQALALRVLELAIENIHLGYAPQEQGDKIADLNRTLTESGSVWTVDVQRIPEQVNVHPFGMRDGFREIRILRRRTAPEAGEAVKQTLDRSPRSGEYLASAWQLAFGRSPNPSESYNKAIKAVEAAAIPVVSPNNSSATLGSVIRDMRSAPHKWRFVLESGVRAPADHNPELSPLDVVIAMTDLLWRNHSDRHGVPEGVPASPISQAQAEAAVHLAVTLVHIFNNQIYRV